ncbi:helix-turn-helix transcriptional regulator [Virgisporangium aliadipatigenens]|nr:LuxR C-terminal-related transcriptional regulator [Virgisporangium aliadipatigenens]
MLRLANSPDDPDGQEPMPWSVLIGLRDLIRCDAVTFILLDSQHCAIPFGQEIGFQPDCPVDDPAAFNAAFWCNYWSSPACAYPDTTGDLRTVTTASDFLSDRQLRSSAMYCEYLRFFGGFREMMLCLPSRTGRTLRLLFWRGRGADFSERDRSLLTLLRPHLHRAHTERMRALMPSPALSVRQKELMELVAEGFTNGQIARRLSISEATVRKHLEHVFARLEVTSRTAAVTKFRSDVPAFPITDEPQDWYLTVSA